MKRQRLHALQRLGAALCALKNQNQFLIALPRLEEEMALPAVLPPLAAAKKHGWAQKSLSEMEEEGTPRAWEEKEEVEVKKHDEVEEEEAWQCCLCQLLSPCAVSPDVWQEEEG